MKTIKHETPYGTVTLEAGTAAYPMLVYARLEGKDATYEGIFPLTICLDTIAEPPVVEIGDQVATISWIMDTGACSQNTRLDLRRKKVEVAPSGGDIIGLKEEVAKLRAQISVLAELLYAEHATKSRQLRTGHSEPLLRAMITDFDVNASGLDLAEVGKMPYADIISLIEVGYDVNRVSGRNAPLLWKIVFERAYSECSRVQVAPTGTMKPVRMILKEAYQLIECMFEHGQIATAKFLGQNILEAMNTYVKDHTSASSGAFALWYNYADGLFHEFLKDVGRLATKHGCM